MNSNSVTESISPFFFPLSGRHLTLWCYFFTFHFFYVTVIIRSCARLREEKSWHFSPFTTHRQRRSDLLPIKIIMAYDDAIFLLFLSTFISARDHGCHENGNIAFRFTPVSFSPLFGRLMTCHYGINWGMRCVNFSNSLMRHLRYLSEFLIIFRAKHFSLLFARSECRVSYAAEEKMSSGRNEHRNFYLLVDGGGSGRRKHENKTSKGKVSVSEKKFFGWVQSREETQIRQTENFLISLPRTATSERGGSQ